VYTNINIAYVQHRWVLTLVN